MTADGASAVRAWRRLRAGVNILLLPRSIAALLSLLRILPAFVLLCGGSAALARDGRPEAGRTLAQANCARCHAIGRTGTSPFAAAPPFRTLHQRYPVEQLAEALAEGIETGHSAMPEFQLSQTQIADLVAYLRTLER
jgi:cytochrome c